MLLLFWNKKILSKRTYIKLYLFERFICILLKIKDKAYIINFEESKLIRTY